MMENACVHMSKFGLLEFEFVFEGMVSTTWNGEVFKVKLMATVSPMDTLI